MNAQSTEVISGSVVGASLSSLGVLLGQISVANVFETLLITFIGGIGGFLGAEFIKWAKKQVK